MFKLLRANVSENVLKIKALYFHDDYSCSLCDFFAEVYLIKQKEQSTLLCHETCPIREVYFLYCFSSC